MKAFWVSLTLVALASFCAFRPQPATASACTVPYTFTAGTAAVAANVNSNFSALQSCGNNIDHTNIGAAGIYASQIIPDTTAHATFGGTTNYTFTHALTVGGVLSVSGGADGTGLLNVGTNGAFNTDAIHIGSGGCGSDNRTNIHTTATTVQNVAGGGLAVYCNGAERLTVDSLGNEGVQGNVDANAFIAGPASASGYFIGGQTSLNNPYVGCTGTAQACTFRFYTNGTGSASPASVNAVGTYTTTGGVSAGQSITTTARVAAGPDLGSANGDVTANRGGTGVLFLGTSSTYLYYDGSKYLFNGASPVFGHNGYIMPTYSTNGGVTSSNEHVVVGTVIVTCPSSGACYTTITLSGAATYTNDASYSCTAGMSNSGSSLGALTANWTGENLSGTQFQLVSYNYSAADVYYLIFSCTGS